MRKKIFKYVSILVAIIIAFSCFCIPASAQEIPSVDNFEFSDFLFAIQAVIYDSDGNPVDEIIINPDSYNYNISNNSLYIDVSDSKFNSLIKPGYLLLFYFTWTYSQSSPSKIIYFTFPDTYSFVEYFCGENAGDFNPEVCYQTLNKSNCFLTVSHQNSSFGVILSANDNADYFPLVVTVSDNPQNETVFTAPDVYPGMFKFYLDMCSVADFILDCLLKIISCVCNNPLLCLGISMWCVGGAIGLYKRLV